MEHFESSFPLLTLISFMGDAMDFLPTQNPRPQSRFPWQEGYNEHKPCIPPGRPKELTDVSRAIILHGELTPTDRYHHSYADEVP